VNLKYPVKLLFSAALVCGLHPVAATASVFGENFLSGHTKLSYASILLDRGGSFYGGQGAILWDTHFDSPIHGLALDLRHRSATASGYVEATRLDYVVSYSDLLFEESLLPTRLTFAPAFLHTYKQSDNNGYEFNLGLSWNEFLPDGLNLSYSVVYESRVKTSAGAGFYHECGFNYEATVPEWIGLKFHESEPVINFTALLAYRDGLGGPDVDRGFSHALFQCSTEIALFENFSILPAIQHQISMEKTINEKNRTAFLVSGQIRF